MGSEEGELFVDLECGGAATSTPPGEDGSGDSVSSCGSGRKMLSRACSGALSYNGITSKESETDLSRDASNAACGRVQVVIDKCSGEEVVALLGKKTPGDQRKKQNAKKSCKPPRPPKGPLLSASDLKLVKELSELAARKRARIERMKALRKMKEAKRPTSSSNVTAMLMTALFFIVIIFQGAFSGSSTRSVLVESPAPATTKEVWMPFKVFNNVPTNEMNQPSSLSFKSLEQASNLSPREERDAR